MRLPKSSARINGSGNKSFVERIKTINATHTPYNICFLVFPGEVMGSGSITAEKKITVGSMIALCL